MATPIAHACAGVICLFAFSSGERINDIPINAKSAVFFGLLGCLPDVDIIVSLLLKGNPTELHFGPTHSFTFGFVVTILSMPLLIAKSWGLRAGCSIWLAVSSHVVIDGLTGPRVGVSPTHGLAALWPFSDEIYRVPVTVFRGVVHGNLEVLLGWDNLKVAMVEIVILGPLTAVIGWLALSNRRLGKCGGIK